MLSENKNSIVIDDDLLSLALKISGFKIKREVVEEALRLFIEVKNQDMLMNQRKLKKLKGKLKWEGCLSSMRID